MSWKPGVKTLNDDTWNYNGLRFATEQEALDSANELRSRWTLVYETAAHESDDEVNYKFEDGRNVSLEN